MQEPAFREFFQSREVLFGRAKRDLDNLIRDLLQERQEIASRARLVESRRKPYRSCWRKARELKLSDPSQLLDRIPDLIGSRIVCHNLRDIEEITDLLEQSPSLKILQYDQRVEAPDQSGYRATHVDAQIEVDDPPNRIWLPCEIQIRTLLQDAWGVLSRADLYRSTDHVPELVLKLAARMSDQLYALDKMAQDIRDELDRKRESSEEVEAYGVTSDGVNKLFWVKYLDLLTESSLLLIMRFLDRLGVTRIDQLRVLVNDTEAQAEVKDFYLKQFSREPENDELFLATAIIAHEGGKFEVFNEFLKEAYALSDYDCVSCYRRLTSDEVADCWERLDYDNPDTYCAECFARELTECMRCGVVYVTKAGTFCTSCSLYLAKQ